MGQFTIDNYTYRTRDMDLMVQAKVVKKVMPLVGSLKDMRGLTDLKSSVDEDVEGEGVNPKEAERRLTMLASILAPIVETFSNLPDEHMEYVFDACMAITERCEGEPKPGAMWTPIWNSAAKRPMYADINLPKLIQITLFVLNDKFSGYFSGLAPSLGIGVAR